MPTMPIPTDAELLARTAAGDQQAFRELVDRHGRYLYGVAHSLCDNPADAEDLVQETLVAALNGSFRGHSSVRTWLVGILVHQAAMLRRSARRRRTQPLQPDAQHLGNSGSVASVVDARVDLSVMLAELSPEHRQVIILRELEGMSYEQMAEALGVPRGTIESRLHRAREQLRKRFREYQP
ncbi:RNA polymerase sigma factor [Fontivita pretiosa]|uniref:RNA polymerase sigma factor n=1 Tax=Fontivita pretiosa TaxID=2989684 RepID=UPI003D16E6AC